MGDACPHQGIFQDGHQIYCERVIFKTITAIDWIFVGMFNTCTKTPAPLPFGQVSVQNGCLAAIQEKSIVL